MQTSKKFTVQKRQGTTGGLDGHFYEIDLLILGKLRGERDTKKFYLTTNITGVGAFDDVVMRYWQNNDKEETSTIILLQAKHIDDPKKGKVTIEKFKNPKYDKFYLGKYFSDYLSSKEKFNNITEDPVFIGNFKDLNLRYIIFTNAVLDDRFNENKKIDVAHSIFSTNSKGFQFNLFKNHDIVTMLESISCQERIKLLAKALVSCICGKLNYNNMMRMELFKTYHVFLSKNIIDINKDIKQDGKGNNYREGKINPNFMNDDIEDFFQKVLKEEIIYEYANNVIFDNKPSSGLDDVNNRAILVNKVIKSLDSLEKVGEDIIEELGGNVLLLETKTKQLKFADPDMIEDESAKLFIEELKSKVSNLTDYTLSLPCKLVKKKIVNQTEKEPVMLPVGFGNINPTLKGPQQLSSKILNLFEKYKSKKVIEIDNSFVGRGKDLSKEDIKNIGKLVGNVLVYDKNKNMLRLINEGSTEGHTLEFIRNLIDSSQLRNLDIYSYRFDIKIDNFPKETLVIDNNDRNNVKEFISKLEVFTGQANGQELIEIIKDEFRIFYKLTKEEAAESYGRIKNKAIEYWRNGDYYLEKDDDFFKNVVKFNIEFDLRNPVDLFSGREKEISDLHNKIQSSSKKVMSQIISISGLGGIGKSELARKYAYAYRNEYHGNVIWINAECYQTLTESFLRLAQDKLGINVKGIKENRKDIKSIVRDVYEFFSERKSLFIFDDAEKRRAQDGDEGIDIFLPSLPPNTNKPYIIITSRNQKWGNIEVLKLGTFTEKEAMDFIKKALNIENDLQNNEIQMLAEKLEWFPLALTQAISYIKQVDEEIKNVEPNREFKIFDYLKEYKGKTKELLNFPFPDDSNDEYSRTTFTTFQVTIDKIKKKEFGGKALEILDITAYCAPHDIPTIIFLKLVEDDERKLGAAVQLLKQYSLVNLERGLLSVHRLVQEVIRLNLMDKEREEETLRKALLLIGNQNSSERSTRLPQCIFYACTKDGKLSNCEEQATYIWNYASKYRQLIKDFYCTYGEKENTPINLFAINGKKEAIESTLKNIEKDELINKLHEYNAIGYAPIHSAALNGHKEIVKYLIEEQRVDVNFTTRSENTPALIAVLGGQLDVLQYLVSKRAVDINKGGKYGTFPILYAALYARRDLLECLLNNKADILVKDKLTGNNILHNALLHINKCGNHISDIEEIVKYCLEKNKGLVKDVNISGMTPLHFAAEFGTATIVKMLLDYGAEVNVKSHCADPQRVDVEGTKPKFEQIRHADGYDKGYTPLHIAAKRNHLEIVRLLLMRRAIYSALNDKRNTPHDMAEIGSDVEILLRSINQSFQAVLNGKKDELDNLLQGKSSDELKSFLYTCNRNQRTLLQVAIDNKQKDIQKVLTEKLKLV